MTTTRGALSQVLVSAVLGALTWGCSPSIAQDTATVAPNTSLAPSDPITPTVDQTLATQDVSAPLFTEHLFELDKVDRIYPLGQLNGGYHESSGLGVSLIWIKPDVISAGDRLTIYAPADIKLEQYAFYQMGSEPSAWTLIFRVNDRITIRMSVVSEAVPKIMEATTDTPAPTSAEHEPTTRVLLKAGEVIGYTSGSSQAHNWDIWVYDSEHSNQFANPSRYEANYLGERMRTAVCPYDFFDEQMRAEYVELFGGDMAGQTTDCGNASRDVPGSLAGQWYMDADSASGVEIHEDFPYASPLALYENLSREVIIFQVGGQEFRLKADNPTHRDPAEISDRHCYQLFSREDQSPAGYAFFELVSRDEMKLFYSPSGTCPNSPPSSSGQSYYR